MSTATPIVFYLLLHWRSRRYGRRRTSFRKEVGAKAVLRSDVSMILVLHVLYARLADMKTALCTGRMAGLLS